MNSDRIRRISVKGLRCLEDVTLELGEMTVLIGENGSGKSSIVEACELLRRAGFEQFGMPQYVQYRARLVGDA